MKFPLSQNFTCQCRKVNLSVESSDVLRLVCYCKDCRGYYNTLNKLEGSKPNAILDPWGGCDYTHLQPSELTVNAGKVYLNACKIRPNSPINRVYTTCCHTPIFSVGPSKTLLLNSNLLQEKPDVTFRIIGREAIKNKDAPSMSWSVPFSWFWTMPRRIHKDKLSPTPVEIPKEPVVLENFQPG